MSQKILAVYPHPDDETFGKAGTLIEHVSNGDEVTLITSTLGQMGRRMGNPFFANRETLTDIREKELHDACKALGIDDLRMWRMQDKTLQFRDPNYLADRVWKVLDEINPDIVYTFYPEHGVHPDHDAMSRATVLAVSRMSKEQRPVIYGSVVTKEPEKEFGEPDVVNDVTDVLDEKMAAMDAHRSQSELITLPLRKKIKTNPERKEEFMKPFAKEKFWIYSVSDATS